MLWPLACCLSAFVLQYAGLGRWVSRPVIVAAALATITHGVLAFTNESHGLVWKLSAGVQGTHSTDLGVAAWSLFSANLALLALDLAVLIWLVVTVPGSRRSVAVIGPGIVFARIAYNFEVMHHTWGVISLPALSAIGVPLVLYLMALFVFRLFDPVPGARATAVAQMRDAILVLTTHAGRVAYANPAAGELLGRPASDLLGRPVADLLPIELCEPSNPGFQTPGHPDASAAVPLRLGTEPDVKELMVDVTGLVDSFGQPLGRLVVLRDVTEQNQIFARELDQQRALAALREREHLAREMHDTVGQVLGYISMQSQAADKYLRGGDVAQARVVLGQLTQVAQDAHDGVRATIAALKGDSESEWLFLPSLQQYAESFGRHYGVSAAVEVAPGVSLDPLDNPTGVQVLRVVQEAMVNALRHGHAQALDIRLEQRGPAIGVSVMDDGSGFKVPATDAPDGHFGMTFMRERMAEIGGSVTFASGAAGVTTVDLTIPF